MACVACDYASGVGLSHHWTSCRETFGTCLKFLATFGQLMLKIAKCYRLEIVMDNLPRVIIT